MSVMAKKTQTPMPAMAPKTKGMETGAISMRMPQMPSEVTMCSPYFPAMLMV